MKQSISEKQLHILQHSLGLDKHGQGRSYRNHYCCGPGHTGYDDCVELVGLGFMVKHKGSLQMTGGDDVFVVTDRGKEAVTWNSPPAPKRTRSQENYRRFLRADCGSGFAEWIGASMEQEHRYAPGRLEYRYLSRNTGVYGEWRSTMKAAKESYREARSNRQRKQSTI